MPKRSVPMTLQSYDDIFSTEDDRQKEKLEHVEQIPISELHPFKNHPFKVVDDESMLRTVESIAQFGVLTPAIARPRPEGGYELISGHRRCHAAEQAGLTTMPVIVREMDDDAAVILMVDSNLQREKILPSERAKAYQMKNEAMKRQAGRPSKENVSQVGTQKRTDQIMAEELGISRNQIQRYIRLNNLIPELLEMVDNKQLSFNPAVELSYLSEKEQRDFLEAMDYTQAPPTLSQAQRIKKLSQNSNQQGVNNVSQSVSGTVTNSSGDAAIESGQAAYTSELHSEPASVLARLSSQAPDDPGTTNPPGSSEVSRKNPAEADQKSSSGTGKSSANLSDDDDDDDGGDGGSDSGRTSGTDACTLEAMCEIMSETKKPDMGHVTLKTDVLRKYFPKSYTPKQMEETIIHLLEQWLRKKQRDQLR